MDSSTAAPLYIIKAERFVYHQPIGLYIINSEGIVYHHDVAVYIIRSARRDLAKQLGGQFELNKRKENEKRVAYATRFSFVLIQQFRTFAYKIEYYLPSIQKLTLLLSGPKKSQGQHRCPDLQAFGKKS